MSDNRDTYKQLRESAALQNETLLQRDITKTMPKDHDLTDLSGPQTAAVDSTRVDSGVLVSVDEATENELRLLTVVNLGEPSKEVRWQPGTLELFALSQHT